jgi:hypothetical protein
MGTPLTTRRRGAETAVQRAPAALSPSCTAAVQFGLRVTDVTMSACHAYGEPSLIYDLTRRSFLPVDVTYILYLPPLAAMPASR